MLITLGRTVLLYILVVVTMRLMGKRQIAQLEPFELVIAIMIAELGVIPMQDRNIPLINGIIAITTLLFIQVTFSVASLRFFGFRSFLDGRYSVIIANGVIQEREMRKARYNLDELFEQLRLKSIFNLGDVEFASDKRCSQCCGCGICHFGDKWRTKRPSQITKKDCDPKRLKD